MSDPSEPDAFTILRSHGFNPTAMGLDYGVQGLADRLARTERALAETREMLTRAQQRAASHCPHSQSPETSQIKEV